ncbi:hypothetical protein R7D97_21540 [Vibrio sp. Vb5031]|uniref:hypothetical protein n=1 Tax=Vibrio TaxID=662 RepID=UPI00265A6856|nr:MULTISPECIES: hypothetical protein [Vibrio]ELA9084658.1 hypothetical protein [Vibrio alginolyticus]MCR9545014.1 hypothetical protein [Vibrio antiquarius]MDW1506778.1 hypothetical protein [Vibrio sp. Vb5031]
MTTDTQKRIEFAEQIQGDSDEFCDEIYLYLEDYFIKTGDIEACKLVLLSLQVLDARNDLGLAKQLLLTKTEKC